MDDITDQMVLREIAGWCDVFHQEKRTLAAIARIKDRDLLPEVIIECQDGPAWPIDAALERLEAPTAGELHKTAVEANKVYRGPDVRCKEVALINDRAIPRFARLD